MLEITDGIHDLGGLKLELAGVLLLAWIICFFTVFKGTKSTGKASHNLTIFCSNQDFLRILRLQRDMLFQPLTKNMMYLLYWIIYVTKPYSSYA